MSPVWSDVSSLSESVKTRLTSESDYSSEDSSLESIKQTKEVKVHKKKSLIDGDVVEKKVTDDIFKILNTDGIVRKFDKKGKVVKKHKMKHRHKMKDKEKGKSQSSLTEHDKFSKAESLDMEESKQRADKSLSPENENLLIDRVKVVKHDKEESKKEEREKLFKVKPEEKDWLLKDDLAKTCKEEKLTKKVRDVTKDSNKSLKEEKEKMSKVNKEKYFKEKEKCSKEEKLKIHKDDKKKKAKDKFSKGEKYLKSDKDRTLRDDKEKLKKEKTRKEELDYEDLKIRNQFLDDDRFSVSDHEDKWFSDLSSDSSFSDLKEDNWSIPIKDLKEHKDGAVGKLVVETMKEESKERKRELKLKEKRELNEKHHDKDMRKKDRDYVEKNAEKKKDTSDKHKSGQGCPLEKEKKRKDSTESAKDRKDKDTFENIKDRKDHVSEYSKERKDLKGKPEDACKGDPREFGSECFFKEKPESDFTGRIIEARERHYSGKEKDKKDGPEKKDRIKMEKHKDKSKEKISLEIDKEKIEKSLIDKFLKDKDTDREKLYREPGSFKDKREQKEKNRDLFSRDKDRKMSAELNKEREKNVMEKYTEKDKDVPERKEKDKIDKQKGTDLELGKEKCWHSRANDIFTDESGDEGHYCEFEGNQMCRSDIQPEKEETKAEREPLFSDKQRRCSLDKHSAEKHKDKELKDKKKDKISDSGKDKKEKCLSERQKEKKDKELGDKFKERKDSMLTNSNLEKKFKLKPPEKVEKRHSSDEKLKAKGKEKIDKELLLKEKRLSKGNIIEEEKKCPEKLQATSFSELKDDSNDKSSEISSDSFTERAHDSAVCSFNDVSNVEHDLGEEKAKDSLFILYTHEKNKEKERNRHSSSSSSKKNHEKDKIKREKRDKSEEFRDAAGKREGSTFEREPLMSDSDLLSHFLKVEKEDELDKSVDAALNEKKDKSESEKELSKKSEKALISIKERDKDKKRKEKHKDKSKDDKEKHKEKHGELTMTCKHSKEEQKSGLKDSLSTVREPNGNKEKAKDDCFKNHDIKQKEKIKDGAEKDKNESVKFRMGENDKLNPPKEVFRKDSRPKEKLLVDGDLMMTSFERMLSQKDLEIEERHKKHKERMKLKEKLRHRSGDPKLREKFRNAEEV
eukprot:g43897.t1